MPGPMAALAVIQQAAGAIQGVVDQIRRLPDQVRGFVEAFNPASVERLDQAYRSLSATLGYAFEPIIQAATATVEGFADAIASGMDQLRGPIAAVSGLFVGSLRPAMAAASDVISGLADAAKELEPLLTPLGAVVEATLAFGRLLTSLGVEALLAAIRQLVPGAESLASLTDAVSEGFLTLSDTTIRLADFMLDLVGAGAVFEKFLKRLAAEPERGGRRQGAPTGFAMGGLEDLYRRRLLAAAQAGGPSVAEQSRDFLKDLRELAKNILDEMKNRPQEREARRQGAGDAAGGALGANVGWQAFMNWLRQQDRNRP